MTTTAEKIKEIKEGCDLIEYSTETICNSTHLCKRCKKELEKYEEAQKEVDMYKEKLIAQTELNSILNNENFQLKEKLDIAYNNFSDLNTSAHKEIDELKEENLRLKEAIKNYVCRFEKNGISRDDR